MIRYYVAIATSVATLAACAAPSPASILSATLMPLPSSTSAASVNPSPSRATIVVTDPFIVAAQYLANGEFNVPAANAPSEAGYHAAFSATHAVPDKLDPAKGKRLVVALRDISRPQQRCESDDPRAGCATVDWSDEPNTPKVPRNGVFENSIAMQFVSGPRTYYLSASGVLADKPDPVDPAHRQSAVGGSPREWSAIISDDLVAKSALELKLVMTKFGAPAVRIMYDIRVQPTR